MRFLKSEYGFPNIKNQKNHSEYRMVFLIQYFQAGNLPSKLFNSGNVLIYKGHRHLH